MALIVEQKNHYAAKASKVGPSLLLVAAASVFSACGQSLKPHDNKDAQDQDAAAAAATTDPTAAEATGKDASAPSSSAAPAKPATPASFEFTANYKPRPLDVIIIRDNQARNYGYYYQRAQAAMPLLTARLWNLSNVVGSVHVGIFDHYFYDNNPNDDVVPPNTGTPIVDAKNDTKVLTAESMSAIDFDTAIEARMDITGTRGGQAMPASVIKAIVDESNKAKGGDVAGLLRKDAYLSILLIGATINPADPYDVQDVAEALKDHAGNYSISALVPDKEGCTVVNVDPPYKSNPSSLPQRNLEIKLQELSDGVFGSICSNTYTVFMDEFASKATGTEFFPVKLPGNIVSIKRVMTDSGVEVKDFRFVKGTPTLEVTTMIASGTKFKVDAMLEGAPDTVVSSTSDTDTLPSVDQNNVSPEEAAFLKDVQPKLQANCASCHAGRPYNTNGGYASAKAYKTEIARRLNLPTTDPQRMPPNNGVISAADKTAILNWATSP